MVHVISIEMPMPCECMSQSQSQSQSNIILCNVFILFHLNGINGLEKFFWLEMFLVAIRFHFIIVGLLLAECMESQFGYLCVCVCVRLCVDIFGFPEATSHIRCVYIGK